MKKQGRYRFDVQVDEKVRRTTVTWIDEETCAHVAVGISSDFRMAWDRAMENFRQWLMEAVQIDEKKQLRECPVTLSCVLPKDHQGDCL